MRNSRIWTAITATIVLAAALTLTGPDRAASQIGITGWRCYPAKDAKGAAKFAPVDLVLNGTLEGSTVPATKPPFFSDPANKITNSTSGPTLACYKIKAQKGAPKFPATEVDITSAIANETLKLTKSKLFCMFVTR